MRSFDTMAEALAYTMQTGEPSRFHAEPASPEFIAEMERLRQERIAAYAAASGVWLD